MHLKTNQAAAFENGESCRVMAASLFHEKGQNEVVMNLMKD